MTTIINKKVLLALGMIVFIGAVVAAGTGAFFSDTETSTGNTFTAGAIDLGIDNESYYNGTRNDGTSWDIDWDISKNDAGESEVRQFFNFLDLKPGDWGEDTISLHVNNNDSYLCADVTLTSNDDNSSTEPELEDGDQQDDPSDFWDGELAQNIKWYWWADDGDNVYEEHETLINDGVSFPGQAGTYTVALADSHTNVWGDNSTTTNALPGGEVRYIAKAWCFGDSDFEPYTQDDDTSPIVRPVQCSGANQTNITQTDGMTMDLSFSAVQSRNNDEFVCSTPEQQPEPTHVTSATLQYGPNGWAGWSCPANTTVVDGSLVVSGGDLVSTYVWKPGATTGTVTYPSTPHGYTYGSGETGYIGQNDNDSGESIVLSFDCLPN